jgi:LysR family hydrogen peroxide-inducible transcriptional activator
MNLQDFKYLVALAEERHFGRAADACNVSQPTLSSQIRKLEDLLGVRLLERTNKRVDLTPVGRKIVEHARQSLAQAHEIETVAQAARDPLVGPLRLGVIPTLAPYLMPIILKPLRSACPRMTLELWEDQTRALIEGLRSHRLDAALLATPAGAPEVTEIELFREPLLAALSPDHRLADVDPIHEDDLAEELLVLAEGHCLADQALAACGAQNGPARNPTQASMQAATLETLIHLVAAGYGATLIPWLAVDSLGRLGVVTRSLSGQPFRSVRLVSRPGFPRPQALRALEGVIRRELASHLPSGCLEALSPVEKRAGNHRKNPRNSR